MLHIATYIIYLINEKKYVFINNHYPFLAAGHTQTYFDWWQTHTQKVWMVKWNNVCVYIWMIQHYPEPHHHHWSFVTNIFFFPHSIHLAIQIMIFSLFYIRLLLINLFVRNEQKIKSQIAGEKKTKKKSKFNNPVLNLIDIFWQIWWCQFVCLIFFKDVNVCVCVCVCVR